MWLRCLAQCNMSREVGRHKEVEGGGHTFFHFAKKYIPHTAFFFSFFFVDAFFLFSFFL